MLNTIHFCESGTTILQCLMKTIYHDPANQRGDVENIFPESTEKNIVKDPDTILTSSLIKKGTIHSVFPEWPQFMLFNWHIY